MSNTSSDDGGVMKPMYEAYGARPAFPSAGRRGMTIRDHLAARALAGYISAWPTQSSHPEPEPCGDAAAELAEKALAALERNGAGEGYGDKPALPGPDGAGLTIRDMLTAEALAGMAASEGQAWAQNDQIDEANRETQAEGAWEIADCALRTLARNEENRRRGKTTSDAGSGGSRTEEQNR